MASPPITITSYAPGLYAANSLADTFLSSTVTPANFRGDPLVGVFRGDGIFSSGNYDANLLALYNFVLPFNGPLVVIDDDFDALDSSSSAYLRSCFEATSKLFSSDQATQPRVVSNTASTPTVLAGIFMGIGRSSTPQLDSIKLAWTLAASYSRTTQYSPWLSGMQAVSAFTEWDSSPPVYGFKSYEPTLNQDANRANYFTKLSYAWQGSAVTKTEDVAALATVALTRPGIERMVNPTLVPFLVLVDPN